MHNLNFKTLSNFNYNKPTTSQHSKMLRMQRDINEIQEVILEHSDIIPVLKTNKFEFLYKKLAKKLTEIESSKTQDFYLYLTELQNQFKDSTSILEIYGTNDPNDLIKKLFIEAKLFDLFVSKLNDAFLLLNLKYNNENGHFEENYQENLSKIEMLKHIFDKLNVKRKDSVSTKASTKAAFVQIQQEKEYFEILSPEKKKVNYEQYNYESSNLNKINDLIICKDEEKKKINSHASDSATLESINKQEIESFFF